MPIRLAGLLAGALALPALALAQAAPEPAPAATLIKEGTALHDEGKYDEAVARYQRVLPGDSAYATAQAELALSLMAAGKYQASLEATQRARQREPFDPQVYATQADDYEGLKQLAEARQTYAAALKLFPYNENLWINQGILELNQKQLAPALTSLQRAVALRPGKSSGHRLLGIAAAEQGQTSHAMLSLLTFLAIEPEGERSQPVLVDLERMATGVPVVEPADMLAPVAPNAAFEELDQLIAAKVALTPGYVSKVKFKANIVKQVQLLVEKFPVDADPASDFWVRAYAPLVRALRQGDNLTTFTYLILSSANDKSALQWVKSNKARLEQLTKDVSGPLLALRDQQPLGGAQVPAWYDGGQIEALGAGQRDAKGDLQPSGNWVLVAKDGSLSERGAFDANHKRTGQWQLLRPDGLVEGEVLYANGELEGASRHYHPGGKLKSEVTYKNGKAEGLLKNYAEDGHLSESRQLAKGDYEGDATDYYADGKPSFKVLMHADEKNGLLERYYPDGTLRLHVQYAQGKAQGEQVEYYPDKTVERRLNLVQDELQGPYTTYFPSGKEHETGQFTAGKRTGTWKEYFSNGKLSVEKSYDAAGELHGAYHDYDWQGRHYADSQYEHGRIVRTVSLDAKGQPRPGADYLLKKGRTPVKSYDADGRLLTTGELENGKLVGEWKTYFPDGTLRDVTHYGADGTRTGVAEAYYANGQLHQRRSYNAQGEAHGYLEQFYPDGQLRQQGYELSGQDEGLWKYFYPNGRVAQERELFRGEQSGAARGYTPAGQPADDQQYLYGKLTQVAAHDSTGRVLGQQALGPATREVLAYVPGLPGKAVLTRSAVADGRYEGPITWYWPGGQPEITLAMRDGHRYGPYRRFYPSGQVQLENTYLNGQLLGASTAYFASGTPSAKGRYLDSQPVGDWTTYYPNGKVQRELHYSDDGDLDGLSRYYNPAGELLLEQRYEQGRLVGFAGPGATAAASGTAQALPAAGGAVTTTFAGGKPAAQGAYAHNYPSGTFTYYYASGQVFRREQYEKGVLSGPAVSYWPTGKPMQEENYQHGELHGRCRYYHPDGTPEHELTYRVGERHGPAVYYDAQGHPQHRYTFWNDAVYSGQ